MKNAGTEDKIKKQLLRNKYYLRYLNKEIYNFSFVSQTKQLYLLDAGDNLIKTEIVHLCTLLEQQNVDYSTSVDLLFNPSDYLVSPFNSTEKFINNQYFLTQQQEEIKHKIIKSISSVKPDKFISIIGSAGTGKTLLIYDIAKSIININKKVLLIHCGNLNNGQLELRNLGWEITSIKNFKMYNLSSYDMIFIDEAQQIYSYQFDKVVSTISAANNSCIFSYDKIQTLSLREENTDIDCKISSLPFIKNYKLSEKIRTNKEIAVFMKMLFDEKRKLSLANENNIELNYFKDLNGANFYLKSLESSDCEILKFTPSQYDHEYHDKYSENCSQTSHQVIGQEFDNVAIIVDRYFNYDENSKLVYTGNTYYHASKMLFQNITRTRKKLNLIIINNEKILDRCITILNS